MPYLTQDAIGRTLDYMWSTQNSEVVFDSMEPPEAFSQERTPEYEAETMKRQAPKRTVIPDDIARLVLFLASDDSGAITNQSYVVDAGWV